MAVIALAQFLRSRVALVPGVGYQSCPRGVCPWPMATEVTTPGQSVGKTNRQKRRSVAGLNPFGGGREQSKWRLSSIPDGVLGPSHARHRNAGTPALETLEGIQPERPVRWRSASMPDRNPPLAISESGREGHADSNGTDTPTQTALKRHSENIGND